MAIPTDHLMLWTEIYNGIPGKPRTRIVECGWCCCSKADTVMTAFGKVSDELHKRYPKNKYCVLSYPEDRVARKFKASDRILGVFG